MSQIVTKFIQDGAITNVKVNASAGIQYSKLNLTDGIKNADVSSVAAIAYAKLNLSGSIQNSDISASAAIDASKIANGSVSSIEFQYLDGVTSAIQTQLDGKANTALSNLTSTAVNLALIPGTNGNLDLGSSGNTWRDIYSVTSRASSYFEVGSVGKFESGVTAPDGTIYDSALHGDLNKSISLSTINQAASTPNVGIYTGNSSAGNSGSILIKIGTASGTRGNITFDAQVINLNAAGSISANSVNITSVADPVNPQDAATKNYVDTQVGSSVTPNKETFVLSGTDITNQYIDLAQVAKTNSILFEVKGAGSLLEGASYDYSVDYTGGAGGKTRITFLNDLATGGNAALVATDVVQVNYLY